MSKLRKNELSRLRLLQSKWFPGQPFDIETATDAAALEEIYWERFEISIQNGVAKALGA